MNKLFINNYCNFSICTKEIDRPNYFELCRKLSCSVCDILNNAHQQHLNTWISSSQRWKHLVHVLDSDATIWVNKSWWESARQGDVTAVISIIIMFFVTQFWACSVLVWTFCFVSVSKLCCIDVALHANFSEEFILFSQREIKFFKSSEIL